MFATFRRPVKPTRVAEKPDAPFAEGILPVTTLAARGDLELIEDSLWYEQPYGRDFYRYKVVSAGKTLAGFDILADAQCFFAMHGALAVDPVVLPVAPVKPRHTPEDEAWYAETVLATRVELPMLQPLSGGAPRDFDAEYADRLADEWVERGLAGCSLPTRRMTLEEWLDERAPDSYADECRELIG